MRRPALAFAVVVSVVISVAELAPAADFRLPAGARPGPAAGLYFVPGSHDSLLVDAVGWLYSYSPQDESGRMQILPTGRRYTSVAEAPAGGSGGRETGRIENH
jgi:hypothetical protein